MVPGLRSMLVEGHEEADPAFGLGDAFGEFKPIKPKWCPDNPLGAFGLGLHEALCLPNSPWAERLA